MSSFAEFDAAESIAANELAFAVRDEQPASVGHVVVVPRRPVADWWEATSLEKLAIIELIDAVKRRLDAELAPDGYNVGFDSGAAAGQTGSQLQVHVIPRFDNGGDTPGGGLRHVVPRASPGPTPATPGDSLITPLDGRLRTELLRSLTNPDHDRIDLLVSFVMQSGINLIAARIDDALARGAHVRLLTTDYLKITDSSALGFFLDRLDQPASGQLEARVFSGGSTSFHPKAYLFSSSSAGSGVAFVGSSNLSHSGINTGVEWNLQTAHMDALLQEFDRLWNDPRSIELTGEWLTEYERLRELKRSAPDDELQPDADQSAITEAEAEVDSTPAPWSVQTEALNALTATRLDGHRAGLVVMATGLGKTWLAAFDSTRPEFRRVLFVAHREEILRQSRDVYRRIRPGGSFGMYVGDDKQPTGDVVFASVQSLHRNLSVFAPDSFDYIVVDEFHHASADTYRRVLAHFRPGFMLGLTATPHRADNADLLSLCGDNLVYDCGLVDGVRRQLLSPFRYRAIPDVADYEHIPWRSGRFDPGELTRQIATLERAQQVFDEWTAAGETERRALGFCCTIEHADFMADYFRGRGVAAVAVHSGPTSSPRLDSLDRLAEGKTAIIFTVDLFNEGVDVPSIDLVMMLRPTESSVVFMQQLGRGLRQSDGKDRLEVVDLVGNHRGFLLKARLLAALAGSPNLTDREAVELLQQKSGGFEADSNELPDGCSIVVEPEVVDLLQSMLGAMSPLDRHTELVRQWIDEHEGMRPTAPELTLVTGKGFNLKSQGGWFGFLDSLGALSPDEQKVVALAQDFLRWIENGSYTKSYKLVTLLAILQAGTLRTGSPVSGVAELSRWLVFRDSSLAADLSDAKSAFEDATRPTAAEWERYWRKNPIAALIGTTSKQEPWFVLDDDRLHLKFEVPDELGDTFDRMVQEIVEYRLHRYLVGNQRRLIGEIFQPEVDGELIDATFAVESTHGAPTSVIIQSAGGTAGSKGSRNQQYPQGLDLVLQRLGEAGGSLVDAYVDSSRTTDLPVSDRRLDPGGSGFPVELSRGADMEQLRKSLLRSMARVGRRPGIKGSGNSRKRARFVISVDPIWSASSLADALALGTTDQMPSSKATFERQTS